MNDLFDTLSEDHRNDKIALLYESNRNNLVAVNTAVGMTEQINIPEIVQQGGTWGPVLCSNTVDTIVRCECGLDSISLNTFINTQIEIKKTQIQCA